MNISELSSMSSDNKSESLVKKHKILLRLQEMGFQVEPVRNPYTGKYDQSLVSVNQFLCFLLPLDNSPRILSDVVLTDTDFIIATASMGNLYSYYIIPSDHMLENKTSYPLDYLSYKDRWELIGNFYNDNNEEIK